MRVMFLGDTHADLRFVNAATDFAVTQSADVIVQAGDFGVWDHIQAGVDFLDGVDARLQQKDKWLIFVDGNHENFERLYGVYDLDLGTGFRPVRERILHAPRGHVWGMGGLNFLAFGGASSIDGPDGPGWWPQARGVGNGWWPEERITESDVYEAFINIAGAPIDVIIAHDCPIEVDIPGISGYPAGDACREAVSEVMHVARPQLLVCGHYHRRHSDLVNQTRIEILAGNEQKSGHAILLDTEEFTLITEAA